MRLVLPEAGDALRRAGNCTCLDLVCDECWWLVLALGLGLWSFGLRTACPEVGVYLTLPKWSVLGSSQSRALLYPALCSPNLCDTPAPRSCPSPTLSPLPKDQGMQEMMLGMSCELPNHHELWTGRVHMGEKSLAGHFGGSCV